MTEISQPIQRMLDATNAENREAFVASFTDDAYLEDWGRSFRGHDGVASWNESDNIGKHTRFEATAERIVSDAEGDDHIVTLVVSGDGYNGTDDIHFRLRDGLIASMVIPQG